MASSAHGPDVKETSQHVEQPMEEKPRDDEVTEFIDKRLQRRLVLKQDLIIVPLLALSIMFGYLDRGNIGNARLLGLTKDLNLSNQQYLNIVMMFFLGYSKLRIPTRSPSSYRFGFTQHFSGGPLLGVSGAVIVLIELPAGMTLRYVHPRYVFSGALISFGLFSTLFTVSGYAGFMVLRVLIGLAEVFVTNAYIFISLWYMPNELSLRTAAVYSMTPVAGALSGLLAYGIGKGLEGAQGLPSWKWLFLIEGVATIAFGFVVLALLPGLPETVANKGALFFRDERERSVTMQRLRRSQNTTHAGFQAHQVWMAAKDPKIYLGALIIGPIGIGIGAFNVFLPTFINAFGYDRLHTQLLTIIPYACALVSMLFFAWLSDHVGRKAIFCIAGYGVCCVGFIIFLTVTTNKVVLLVGACLVACGSYPALVIALAWNVTLHGGYTKRATCIWAIQIALQSYSIIATQVYRDAPRFVLGHSVSLGLYAVGMVAAVVLYLLVSRQNRLRQARRMELEQRGETDPEMEKSFEELGDFHPGWKYTT